MSRSGARPGPEGGARDLNRKRRVAALQRAGCRLFLRRGLDQVTIDELAAKARMAKGGFYRYFDDKAALVDSLYAPLLARVEAAFARCASDLAAAPDAAAMFPAYAALASELARLIGDHPDEVLLYLQENRGASSEARRPVIRLAERIFALTTEITEIAVHAGLMRAVQPKVTALAVIGAIESVVHAHLTRRDPAPPAEVPAMVIDLFVAGVARTRS